MVLLNEMFHKGNTLTTRNYDVKKNFCLMGIEYKRIHACPNDCILYKKDLKI